MATQWINDKSLAPPSTSKGSKLLEPNRKNSLGGKRRPFDNRILPIRGRGI